MYIRFHSRRYMNLPAVQTALHVKATSYAVCGGPVYFSTMAGERTLSYMLHRAHLCGCFLTYSAAYPVPLIQALCQ